MASTGDIAQRYFDALSAHDLDAAAACSAPGAVDRLVGAHQRAAAAAL